MQSFGSAKNKHSIITVEIADFCRQNGIDYVPRVKVSDQDVDVAQLFLAVQRVGGFEKANLYQKWPHVANLLDIDINQHHVLDELRHFFANYLRIFEQHYLKAYPSERSNEVAMLSQIQRPSEQLPGSHSGSEAFGGDWAAVPAASSYDGRLDMHNRSLSSQNGPRVSAQPASETLPHQIGRTPGDPGADARHGASVHSLLPFDEASAWTERALSKSLPSIYSPFYSVHAEERQEPRVDRYFNALSDIDLTKTNSSQYSFLDVAFGRSQEAFLRFNTVTPMIEELGSIDMQGLILSLDSGIDLEVRYALDVLLNLACRNSLPLLEQCGDLLEILIEIGETCIGLISSKSPRQSMEPSWLDYETLLSESKSEVFKFRNPDKHQFSDGMLQWTIDKLLCISGILRSFALSEVNHRALYTSSVSGWLSSAIYLLGSCKLPMVTYSNTLTLQKDLLLILSLTSFNQTFADRQEAFPILSFLLSFSPRLEPDHTAYSASTHIYVPLAIDCMTRLMVREPNKTFLKEIFLEASEKPMLLQGLSLVILPTSKVLAERKTALAPAQIAFLIQGLLVTEILVEIINDSTVASAAYQILNVSNILQHLLCFVGSLAQGQGLDLVALVRNTYGRLEAHPEDNADVDDLSLLLSRATSLIEKVSRKCDLRQFDVFASATSHTSIEVAQFWNLVDGLRQLTLSTRR